MLIFKSHLDSFCTSVSPGLSPGTPIPSKGDLSLMSPVSVRCYTAWKGVRFQKVLMRTFNEVFLLPEEMKQLKEVNSLFN